MTQFENYFSEEIWQQTYKDYKDKSIDDTLYRVSKAIASVEKNQELQHIWTEKFYDMLSNFKVTTGGRIYSNAGTEWEGTTLINCFVSPAPSAHPDSLDGIYEVLEDQAKTLKSEGGWGHNFSALRPRGSFINGIGVESPGAVKFMELFDKSSEIVTSGSGLKNKNKKAKGKIRKGAMMGILDITHPDVIEFITAKQTPGRLTKFNISVNCTDEFMNKVIRVLDLKEQNADSELIETEDQWNLEFPDTTYITYNTEWDGDLKSWKAKGYPVKIHKTVSATWLWNLIMESTYNRAEPGVVFLDRANEYYSSNYVNKIYSCNPCIPGYAYVQTDSGPRQVLSLIDKPTTMIINGKKWNTSDLGFFKTGTKDVYRIKTKEGFYIDTTDNHQIAVYDNKNNIKWIENKDIKINDRLVINNHENNNWAGEETFNEGYILGLLFGDGYTHKQGANPCIWVVDENHQYHNKGAEAVMNFVSNIIPQGYSNKWHKVKNRREYRLSNRYITNLVSAFSIERKIINKNIIESSSNFYKGFLSGLFDADGSIQENVENGASIRLSQSNKPMLEEIQRMLLRLGIYSKIYNRAKSHKKYMSNEKTDKKEYVVKDMFELSISADNFTKFIDLIGFKDAVKMTKAKDIIKRYKKGHYKQLKKGTVENITFVGTMDVYDCQVPGINAFDYNGVLVHNCGEQMLPKSGSCNLASINLTQFVLPNGTGFDLTKLKNYTKTLVRFLDNVNDYTHLPLPEYQEYVRKMRRIGCGILGWGSALYMLKVRFGSEKAANLRESVMQTISIAAHEASIDLAEEKGMFEGCIPEKHLNTKFISNLGLSREYVEKLLKYGIRNSSVMSIQPTGNTSIFANIVSGGLEPIYMPEYIRTVIVPTIPEHLVSVTPKFYEGSMFETEFFKWTKEGDEDILRGVDTDGTVYKIDKNRGLTKEVPCEDFGVRWLRNKNEWDPNADWAVAALSLKVEDHVSDMVGFARWIDSAISKTINVPFNYPFEEFTKVYLDAYKVGFIKGVTTYRSGTMTTVLSAKDEKTADQVDEEIILMDAKLPDSSPATMKILKAEGKKWYVTVLMNEAQTRPVAFFVHTNHPEKNVTTNDALEQLFDLAVYKGIPTHFIETTREKISNDNNSTKIARVISLLLRHGVLIRNVVSTLEKVDNIYVGSFLLQIKKYLASYIKDGEKAEGVTCQECGSDKVIFQEGCHVCQQCGSSKCG